MVEHAKLIALIKKLAYKEGSFVLSSGQKSSFYVDIKNLALHPEGAAEIASLAWKTLDPRTFSAVGGPTLGADPILMALSLEAYRQGVVLPAFIIRKEPKKHGTSQYLEGKENLKAGSEVLIVEDVVTTGGSSLQAIEKARAEGFEVRKLFCVLDRLQGGREALEKIGVSLFALATIDEIRKSS